MEYKVFFNVLISANRYLIILFLNDYITKLLINNLLAEIYSQHHPLPKDS